MSDLLLLNGPNLGTLGTRQPQIYGTTTLAEIEAEARACAAAAGFGLRAEQHDDEAGLLAALRRNADTAGAVVNPGALMMAGWSLRDALADYPAPWIEVHISNIYAREGFRHRSVLSALAAGVIAGLGTDGYVLAVAALARSVGTGREQR
jgi:5-deoxy-5-amino-3-dehydroquinate dehydratase